MSHSRRDPSPASRFDDFFATSRCRTKRPSLFDSSPWLSSIKPPYGSLLLSRRGRFSSAAAVLQPACRANFGLQRGTRSRRLAAALRRYIKSRPAAVRAAFRAAPQCPVTFRMPVAAANCRQQWVCPQFRVITRASSRISFSSRSLVKKKERRKRRDSAESPIYRNPPFPSGRHFDSHASALPEVPECVERTG